MNTRQSRALVGAARIEAGLLARNVLVLAGLLAGGLAVWELAIVHHSQLLWWSSGWEIGSYGQVVLSVTAVVAAHLATTRARRDGLAQLYASFPTSEPTRTLGHLLALLGVIVPSLALLGVTTALFEVHGILGSTDLWVLGAGVLLVVAGGTVGVAIGRWLPHPMAGIVGALAWFVLPGQSNQYNSAVVWLFPWASPQLTTLPGPLTGYPPATAHAAELAGIALLAAVVALIARASRPERVPVAWPRWVIVGIAGLVCVAAIAAAGVAQFRPIPAAALSRAVNQVAHPDAQHCELLTAGANTARYCVFAAFTPLVPDLEGVVGEVLARVPGGHAQPLLIAQTSQLTLDDPTLTHGQSRSDIAAWARELAAAPANRPSTTALYLDLASWPVKGHQAKARFALSLGAAEWAVGLPTGTGTADQDQPCAPVDQAREAIAIWLADQATHTNPRPGQAVTPANGFIPIAAGGQSLVGWSYPGLSVDYLSSPGPQTTATGYLLATAMNQLPAQRVAQVLAQQWTTWTDPRTTDSQLAAALGISMPTVPTGITTPRGRTIMPPPGSMPDLRVCQ
jgi:hypothetical protein